MPLFRFRVQKYNLSCIQCVFLCTFLFYFQPMGRMINQIGTIIRGRNTPHYKNNEVNLKNGEICVIVNA